MNATTLRGAAIDTLRKFKYEVGERGRRRVWRRESRRGFASYFGRHDVPKLHLGAGLQGLDGWLDTDLAPHESGVWFLDATEPFPFPDCSFRYVFSEHMIEHIPYGDGLRMLGECRRVLQPGGVIRVATPNLVNLVSLVVDAGSGAGQAYLRWALSVNRLPDVPSPACVVLNHFMRAWGHQFIYDPETLAGALEASGFSAPIACSPGQSADPELQGLERHGVLIGDEFNRFETMVLEARRPS